MGDIEKPGNDTHTMDETDAQKTARLLLGSAMTFAGFAHLTFARKDFQAQVPPWVPVEKDTVVLLSGLVEIAMGSSLLLLPKQKEKLGVILAAFFVAVFPGNIAQYTEHRDAFGLDTDQKRFTRLFFQPVLIGWALWATDALKSPKDKKA